DGDPDGLAVETLDGESFLAINGVQTLSFTHCNMLSDLEHPHMAGITSFRLSPHSGDMVAITKLYRSVLDGNLDATKAAEGLAAIIPQARFSNGFLAGSCGAEFVIP